MGILQRQIKAPAQNCSQNVERKSVIVETDFLWQKMQKHFYVHKMVYSQSAMFLSFRHQTKLTANYTKRKEAISSANYKADLSCGNQREIREKESV